MDDNKEQIVSHLKERTMSDKCVSVCVSVCVCVCVCVCVSVSLYLCVCVLGLCDVDQKNLSRFLEFFFRFRF